MVYEWEPGTWYDLGSVVEYQGMPVSRVEGRFRSYCSTWCGVGHKYKIIQAHQSQVSLSQEFHRSWLIWICSLAGSLPRLLLSGVVFLRSTMSITSIMSSARTVEDAIQDTALLRSSSRVRATP